MGRTVGAVLLTLSLGLLSPGVARASRAVEESPAQEKVQEEIRRRDGHFLMVAGGGLLVAGGLVLASPLFTPSCEPEGFCAGPWSAWVFGGTLISAGFITSLMGWTLAGYGPAYPALVVAALGGVLAGWALYQGEPALGGLGLGLLVFGAIVATRAFLTSGRREEEVTVAPLLLSDGGGLALAVRF